MSEADTPSTETLLRRGVDRHAAGSVEDAVADYRRVAVIDPSHAAAARLSGMALAQMGRPADGLEWLLRSTLVDPVNATGWARLSLTMLALASKDRTRVETADMAARRALALSPGGADPCAAMGALRYHVADHTRAVIWSLRAHRLSPGNRDIALALAAGLRDARLFDAAETVYAAILARAPSDREARLGRAVTRLVRGDLTGGWEDFEGRWKRFAAPAWRGEPVEGRRVLLHAEQGFGDTLQFARYAPMLADRGALVTLEVHRALIRLLGRLDPRIRVTEDGGPVEDYDFHCPLMSLPRVFGTTLDTIPPPSPTLMVPPRPAEPDGLVSVGLVWAGNPGHRNDHNRSIPPDALSPLREMPGVGFVSLQTDMGGEARPPGTPWLDGLDHPLRHARDFADTADVVARLDLVMTVDTAMAHLAGTLGRPCWIFLPRAPDWRWLIDRSDTPWYPRARLFRQPRGGDWESVIGMARSALRSLVATRQEAGRPAPRYPDIG